MACISELLKAEADAHQKANGSICGPNGMTLGAIDHRLWCSCILESLVNGADAEKAYADFGISIFDSWYHGRVSAILIGSCSRTCYSLVKEVD